jgi:O-antigen/teichoic acid export membrane protein
VDVFGSGQETIKMSLAHKTISGAKWSTVSRFGQQGLFFIVTIVLTRLLSPDAYGVLGMAMVVTGFINIFKDLGTSSALIQKKELSNSLISSIFWVNVLFGLLAMGIVILITPWVAWFYDEPQVAPLLRVLSFSFVVSGLSITHQALLARQMLFDRLARVELISSAVGGVVGIGMAACGMGVWSLVGQNLSRSFVLTISLWIVSSWHPKFEFDRVKVCSVASYSLNLSGFNVFNYFVRNADNILIGRYLGTTALGYYSLAYRLILYPLQNVSGVLGRVLFPAFTQMQDNDDRFRRVYLRVCATISVVTFPMMLGLLVISQPLVEVFFGSRWMPVATLLMVLVPVGMVQSIGSTVGHIYTAKGRTDWMFRWGIVTGLSVVSFFVVGLRWGVVGVAVSYALWSALVTYPSFSIPFKLIDLPISALWKALWPTLKLSLMMAGCVAIWRLILASVDVTNSWAVLISSVLLGSGVYGGLLLWLRPMVLQDVLNLLPQIWIFEFLGVAER